MKKLSYILLGILTMSTLASCGNRSSQKDEEIFKPTLNKDTSCEIKVVGSYSNFEALLVEFDRFNEYYPNVKLRYEKLDDYENTLSVVLQGNEKPNIFFSESKMIGNEKYTTVVSHMEDLSNPSLNINLSVVRSGLIKKDANNKVLTVPVFSKTCGALVNNDLFGKENIKVPTTWSELIDACETFAKKNYASPIMGYSKDSKPSSGLFNVLSYPSFLAELANNQEALTKANNLEPSAGEYMRNGLNVVNHLINKGYINIENCDEISDNYEKVLLRFFEGDVPIMVCNADTVSGAKKRESKSEKYQANPFNYSFYPLPVTEEGGYFIDSASLEFSVNKNCENLDMTNEFMRFMIRSKELSDLATNKGLIATTNVTSFQSVYAPFATVPKERTFTPEIIGIEGQVFAQIRIASYKVGKGELTVDEAISLYGSFQ